MEKLTIEEEQQVHKILIRRNKKRYTSEVIASMVETLNKLRSGELKLNDWFVPGSVNFEYYVYHFGLYKFVDLNST